MKNLKDILSNNIIESFNNTAEDFDRMSQGLLRSAKASKINPLDSKVLAKCAGYIIEAWIKFVIQMHAWRPGERTYSDDDDNENYEPPKIYENGDAWYDFSIRGDKFEIKSFQKGKKYSNTKLTKAQVEHKDELIFVLCEYEIDSSGPKLNLVNVEFVPGNEMKISGNRMVKK
jgi:hypothetical protein